MNPKLKVALIIIAVCVGFWLVFMTPSEDPGYPEDCIPDPQFLTC